MRELKTSVRTSGGDTKDQSIDIGLPRVIFKVLLFTTLMDVLKKEIQDKVPWRILFADDIVIIDEIGDDLNRKLQQWRLILESRGFRFSMLKTEYL